MRYFIDFEFIEGFHKPLFGKRRHFIDMISVGIVCEDGREYYAISNQFNPKDADQWVKDNVINKLEVELYRKESTYAKTYHSESLTLKNLLKWHGKSNKQIVAGLLEFFGCEREDGHWYAPEGIEVYGYYADYDWVLLCSLFGRMIDLPKGFPMHCIDLKQTLDTRVDNMIFSSRNKFDIMGTTSRPEIPLSEKLAKVKAHPEYPKQTDEHNALADAKWNHELFKFLQTIQCLPA